MGFSQAPALPYHNLGIVEDGDTASQAIEKDKYIIWKGQNYFAKTDILQGETFVVDTNLTAMPEGVINGIVDTLNASLIKLSSYSYTHTSSSGAVSISNARTVFNVPSTATVIGALAVQDTAMGTNGYLIYNSAADFLAGDFFTQNKTYTLNMLYI